MTKYPLFILMILSLTLATGLSAQTNQASESMEEFAAIYSYGEKWDAGKSPAEQPYFIDHSAFLFGLKQAGVITAGIKMSDKSIILFKAKNIEEAKKIFLSDTSVSEKTYRLEVQPATVFYKGCI